MRTVAGKAAGLLLLFFVVGSLMASGRNAWKVTQTIAVGGPGGWDYVTVDSRDHRLYVTRTTHTMVLDPNSGKVIADIPGQKRSHGVALDPKAGRGFISDGGGDGAIVIFDLKSYKVLGTVAAQTDADGIIFDPSTNLVLCVSGDGGVLMILDPTADPKTARIATPIDLGGKPEFLAVDGKGRAYINLEDKDQVAVVDLTTRKVVAHWATAPGGTPVGMSIDPKNGYLFVGCRKPQKLIVMSTRDGKVLADLPIGPGVDATRFEKGEAFASTGGDGKLTVAKEIPNGKFEIVQTVDTAIGARTMGLDSASNTIYLPTADFEAAQPGERRPAIKPDTFKIVVVSH